jgi:hypothetical protein
VGGLAIGGVSLVRPLEGLAVAGLLGVWSLPIRGLLRFGPSAALALGAMLSGVLVRPYNPALTGSASVFPIMAYTDKYYAPGSNDLGFGANRGLGWPGLDPFPGHGLRDVIVNANLNFTSINTELLGWACGSLIAVILLLARGRLRRPDWWMLAAVAMIAGIHSFYWFSGGPDFGARYWYLTIVPLAALAARGVEQLGADLPPGRQPRATLAALALSVMALVTFVPWRAVDKYRNYRGMRPDMRVLASSGRFDHALVLVRGARHPDYASAAIYNPIDLHTDAPIYAWDVSPEVRAAVVRAYAGRPVWVVDGPTLTHDGYRVIAGPLTTEQALGGGTPPR